MSLRILLLRPRITPPQPLEPRLLRRCNHPTSPPPTAAKSPPPPPPPPPPPLSLIHRVSAPVLTVFRFYGSSQRRHPWLTQIATSITTYTLADLNAQLLFPASPDTRSSGDGGVGYYDYVRTLRMGLTGAMLAIPVNAWYKWMSHWFAGYPRAVAVGLRVGLTQVVFTPTFLVAFFGVQGLLEGRAVVEVAARIATTGTRAWWDGLKFWPLVSAVNFYVVPLEYRALFGGLAGLGWNTWLSYLNSRAVGAGAGAGRELGGEAVEAVREKGQAVA